MSVKAAASTEIVRQLFESSFADWPDGDFSRLAEDAVMVVSDGSVYVGHEGYTLWYGEQIRDHADRRFDGGVYTALTDEWVLVRGDSLALRRSGEQQLQPGCWLTRIVDGKVNAAIYYRTEDDARTAVPDSVLGA